MKKQLFLALAIAAMATACTKTPTNPNGDSIMLKGKMLTVDVKSPFDGPLSVSNPLTALVPASLTTADYTTTYASGNMIFTGVSEVSYDGTPTGQTTYPANPTTNVFLAGLYPATGWGALTTTSAITFTGKEDVMAAPEVSTNKNDATNNSYKSLTFGHKLTRLEFSIKATGTAAIAAWGQINEITVTGTETTFANIATVTLKDATAAFSGTETAWPTYEITTPATPVYTDVVFTGKTNVLTTAATKVAYTMLVPVEATGVTNSNEYKISIKATKAGGTQVVISDIPVNLKATGDATDFTGNTAGNSFNIVLSFDVIDIKATATVTPWVLQGNSDVDIK